MSLFELKDLKGSTPISNVVGEASLRLFRRYSAFYMFFYVPSDRWLLVGALLESEVPPRAILQALSVENPGHVVV